MQMKLTEPLDSLSSLPYSPLSPKLELPETGDIADYISTSGSIIFQPNVLLWKILSSYSTSRQFW